MTGYLFELAAMLLVILVAAELFTNALEHLGERLKISEGVTGSLFAAVGTALPETLVPLLAIASKGSASVNQEIGVGAILGAPLMLSTLSAVLMTLAVLKSHWRLGIYAVVLMTAEAASRRGLAATTSNASALSIPAMVALNR